MPAAAAKTNTSTPVMVVYGGDSSPLEATAKLSYAKLSCSRMKRGVYLCYGFDGMQNLEYSEKGEQLLHGILPPVDSANQHKKISMT